MAEVPSTAEGYQAEGKGLAGIRWGMEWAGDERRPARRWWSWQDRDGQIEP